MATSLFFKKPTYTRSTTQPHVEPRGWVFAISQAALLLYIGLAYSEALNYAIAVSPYLLYAAYLGVYGIVAVCLLTKHDWYYPLSAITVYLFWLFFYALWGLLVSPFKAEDASEIARTLIRVITVLIAFPFAVLNRRHVVVLCTIIQIGVIVNCAVCIIELLNPDVTWAIANLLTDNVSVVDPLRKAGLWFNANNAAYAFLCGFLLSHWTKGWFGWIARAAAVVGIYLTVSRSGLYMLLLCAALYSLFYVRRIRITRSHFMLVTFGITIALGVLLVCVQAGLFKQLNGNWNLQRLLDFKEEASGELSRGQLSGIALEQALNGSWYGRGILSFQGGIHSPFWQYTNVGAHNIYIAVLGETGLPGITAYVALLLFGLARTLRTPMQTDDRFVLVLLWLVYLCIGFVYHNQFTAFTSLVFAGVLFHLPLALQTSAQPASVLKVSP